jgi:hypothetical protein
VTAAIERLRKRAYGEQFGWFDMVTITPEVGRIMVSGLTLEIERQEAIGKVCGDDWPDDCDPNDIAIYRSYRDWLIEQSGVDVVIENVASKPVEFVMGLLPYFVRESRTVLSKAEVDAAARTFSQYAAARSRDIVRTGSEHAPFRRNLLWLLESVIVFPEKVDATRWR